jgi:hypothetical protein
MGKVNVSHGFGGFWDPVWGVPGCFVVFPTFILCCDFGHILYVVGGGGCPTGVGTVWLGVGGLFMPRNGGGRGVRTLESGERVLPDQWSEFIDWLVDPVRVPATQKEWAVLNGVSPDTISRWKRHPDFVREWEGRARQLNVGVERTQAVVNALFGAATSGDTKAASLYLQYIDKFTPKHRVVVEDGEVSGLSDAELLAELERLTGEFGG